MIVEHAIVGLLQTTTSELIIPHLQDEFLMEDYEGWVTAAWLFCLS